MLKEVELFSFSSEEEIKEFFGNILVFRRTQVVRQMLVDAGVPLEDQPLLRCMPNGSAYTVLSAWWRTSPHRCAQYHEAVSANGELRLKHADMWIEVERSNGDDVEITPVGYRNLVIRTAQPNRHSSKEALAHSKWLEFGALVSELLKNEVIETAV